MLQDPGWNKISQSLSYANTLTRSYIHTNFYYTQRSSWIEFPIKWEWKWCMIFFWVNKILQSPKMEPIFTLQKSTSSPKAPGCVSLHACTCLCVWVCNTILVCFKEFIHLWYSHTIKMCIYKGRFRLRRINNTKKWIYILNFGHLANTTNHIKWEKLENAFIIDRCCLN